MISLILEAGTEIARHPAPDSVGLTAVLTITIIFFILGVPLYGIGTLTPLLDNKIRSHPKISVFWNRSAHFITKLSYYNSDQHATHFRLKLVSQLKVYSRDALDPNRTEEPGILPPIDPLLSQKAWLFFLEILIGLQIITWAYIPYVGWSNMSPSSGIIFTLRNYLLLPDFVAQPEALRTLYWVVWIIHLIFPVFIIGVHVFLSYENRRLFHRWNPGTYFSLWPNFYCSILAPSTIYILWQNMFYCGIWDSIKCYEPEHNSYMAFTIIFTFFYAPSAILWPTIFSDEQLKVCSFHPFMQTTQQSVFRILIPALVAGTQSIDVSPRIFLYVYTIVLFILLIFHIIVQTSVGLDETRILNNLRTFFLTTSFLGGLSALVRFEGVPYLDPNTTFYIAISIGAISFILNDFRSKHMVLPNKAFFDQFANYKYGDNIANYKEVRILGSISSFLLDVTLLDTLKYPNVLYDKWDHTEEPLQPEGNGILELSDQELRRLALGRTDPILQAADGADLVAFYKTGHQVFTNNPPARQPGTRHNLPPKFSLLQRITANGCILELQTRLHALTQNHYWYNDVGSQISPLSFTPVARRASQLVQNSSWYHLLGFGYPSVPTVMSTKGYDLPPCRTAAAMQSSLSFKNYLFRQLSATVNTRNTNWGSTAHYAIELMGSALYNMEILTSCRLFWENGYQQIQGDPLTRSVRALKIAIGRDIEQEINEYLAQGLRGNSLATKMVSTGVNLVHASIREVYPIPLEIVEEDAAVPVDEEAVNVTR